MFENADYMLQGFMLALQPHNLFFTFVGCLLGTIVGILPGLGPTAGMALLLPATFGMEPASAIMLLAGIYYGSMYGGSTTSILINTPGESSSVMTALDGYQMAKNGRAGAALAISAIASFIAGTLGVVLLSLLAVPLASFALKFGPAEYFGLLLFAMMSVSALTGDSFAKGLFSLLLGLMIATVGIDLQSGMSRFTGGVPILQDGIGFIVAAVGLFAVAEVFCTLEALMKGPSEIIGIRGGLWITWEEWRRSVWPILRGTVIGFVQGILPGGGATVSTILSYGLERSLSKDGKKFGSGMIEGVAGPEAANNASISGSLMPLLTLGLPGSGTTAVLLGALIIHGIQPGPLMMQKHPELVWGVIDSMYIGNVILFILNLPLVALFVRILYIPTTILLPIVLVLAALGVYTLNGSVTELYIALLFGLLGYAFRKADIPVAPLILALVLGAPLEQSFRQAMTISGADLAIFVKSGISTTLIAATVIMIVAPLVMAKRRMKRVE